MDGVLNVLKPAGMTSFDVIACLRRIYGQKRLVTAEHWILWQQACFLYFWDAQLD